MGGGWKKIRKCNKQGIGKSEKLTSSALESREIDSHKIATFLQFNVSVTDPDIICTDYWPEG